MRCILITSVVALGVVYCVPVCADETGEDGLSGSDTGVRHFHILKGLPVKAEAYQGPAADLVKRGVPEKYGHEEWFAVVLAHELHQHAGIMTVVGAKMAVRARELLQAPPRSVKVTAQTGTEPPYACALDGLQAGLGSTFGQHLIEAPPVEEPRLAAVFEHDGRRIKLSLRPDYQLQISQFIRGAIEAHGNLTADYFEEIEAQSYRVWAEFDRAEIFVEEDLSEPASDTPGSDSSGSAAPTTTAATVE